MGKDSGIQWTKAEKRQARIRVNVAVRLGRMPHANTLPCADCGHCWSHEQRRHEYDHHMGYAPENALQVESVCTTCHRARCMARGEISVEKLKKAAAVRSAGRKTTCSAGHPMQRFADGKWRCHQCRLEYYRRRYKERRANG